MGIPKCFFIFCSTIEKVMSSANSKMTIHSVAVKSKIKTEMDHLFKFISQILLSII